MVYMDGMKSTGDVLKILNITKVTLFGWIRNGLIKADKVPARTRSFYVFSDEEVDRLKNLLPKKRKRGFQLMESIKKK